ncbi:MAG TPA: methylmalonyl Co-A mutase-associated GTPase MeaB [Candidatus Methylomirabilis sp.]|nr:methylmalonyl Co-A mutase-associated GTPase MeaB [Candidatus Methylomirabilis sp.]
MVDPANILEGLKARRPASLARAISIVENASAGSEALLGGLHSLVGGARRIGITGPPGAGKSTLIERLAAHWRTGGLTVGIIAIDPTSPFTGGALLGDRIRMERAALDPGVFIRSMASRGSLGGMATTTGEVADVMDAYGFDRILVETVGVGQSELDVASVSDTTVVVLVPESGDGIQVMKAGLMEIADVYVVNKADRPGADRLRQELEVAIGLKSGQAFRHVPGHHGHDSSETRSSEGGKAKAKDMAWEPPVLATVAPRDEGVAELSGALDRHFRWLERDGGLAARRARQLERRTREVLERAVRRWAWSDAAPRAALEAALADVASGRRSPYEAAAAAVERIRRSERA